MLSKLNNGKIILIVFMMISIPLFGNQTGNEDAVYLNVQHEYILNTDGTITYNYQHKIKLFTSFAFTRQYGESFIIYNPDTQKLKVTKSNTTMADGKIVESPFNAFNEVLPRFAANAAPYLNLREMVVTHIGLEENSIIDFAYTLESKKGMYPGLIGKQIIGDRNPIDNLSIVVKVPKDHELNYFLAEGNTEPLRSSDNDHDIYTWNFQNLPLVEVETQQPQMEDFIPVLYFSSASSKNIINYILGEGNSIYKLPHAALELIKEITKEKKSKMGKAFALQDYVQSLIGNMDGDLIYTGYKSLNASVVFQRNVGSKLDKAVLLAAMLKNIEIDAVPVLVSNSPNVKTDVLLLGQFEDVAVLCNGLLPNGEDLFIDPIHKQQGFFPSNMLNKFYFTITKNALVAPFKTELLKKNNISLEGEFVFATDGALSGNIAFDINGYFNDNRCPEKLTANIVNEFKNAGVILQFPADNNFNQEKNIFNSNAEVKLSSIKNEVANIYELTLPCFPGGVNDLHIPINKSLRTTPVILPIAFDEEYNYEITLPENYSLVINPEPVIIKNIAGEVLSIIKQDKNKIIIKRRISLNNVRIEAAQYPDVYELVSGWNDKYHNKLYIK